MSVIYQYQKRSDWYWEAYLDVSKYIGKFNGMCHSLMRAIGYTDHDIEFEDMPDFEMCESRSMPELYLLHPDEEVYGTRRFRWTIDTDPELGEIDRKELRETILLFAYYIALYNEISL